METLFRSAPDGPAPRGVFEGRFLCWVEKPPLALFAVDSVLFRAIRFGIDFDRGHWWFIRTAVAAGRFRTSWGPSRWRNTDALRLEYDVSRLPGPVRRLLYDEVKPLTDDAGLGLGGVNRDGQEAAHFFFSLTRR